MSLIPTNNRTLGVDLVGGAELVVTDVPVNGAGVYDLVFGTWTPRDGRPLTYAMERDQAAALRDHLTHLLDNPHPSAPPPPAGLLPLAAIRRDRLAGRAARQALHELDDDELAAMLAPLAARGDDPRAGLTRPAAELANALRRELATREREREAVA